MNSIYQDYHVYNFPPEGSSGHLCEDQICDRNLTSYWLEESELWQRLQMGWGDPRRDTKATFLVAPWTTHAVAWSRQPSWGERRDHRFQLLPTEHNLEFQFGQVICLLKAQMNCFGLGFMFTTKMSLKKQLLCWYLRLMQYVGARMFLLDRSKACVNGQC